MPPADFRRRGIARAIDLLIALAPLWLAPRGHPIAAALLSGAILFFSDSLFGPGRSGRTDIILATRAALEAQFLRRRLIGQVHDHAAIGACSDHVRLLALRPRRGLGPRAVIGILERR